MPVSIIVHWWLGILFCPKKTAVTVTLRENTILGRLQRILKLHVFHTAYIKIFSTQTHLVSL